MESEVVRRRRGAVRVLRGPELRVRNACRAVREARVRAASRGQRLLGCFLGCCGMAGARERRNGIDFGGDLLSGVEGVAKSSVRAWSSC